MCRCIHSRSRDLLEITQYVVITSTSQTVRDQAPTRSVLVVFGVDGSGRVWMATTWGGCEVFGSGLWEVGGVSEGALLVGWWGSGDAGGEESSLARWGVGVDGESLLVED